MANGFELKLNHDKIDYSCHFCSSESNVNGIGPVSSIMPQLKGGGGQKVTSLKQIRHIYVTQYIYSK